MGPILGRSCGPTKQVPLPRIHAQGSNGDKFLFGLDAFRHQDGMNLASETHHCSSQGPLRLILVNTSDDVSIQLNQVRPELKDMTHGSEPGTGIINGDPQAHAPQGLQRRGERSIIVHRLTFGNLQHDASGTETGPVNKPGNSRVQAGLWR